MTRRVFSKSLLALSLGLTLVGSAVAQSYPSRPITMVVPWGAGGGTDATARIVAALMEKEMGQPVNVVNRTGGNGVVGHSAIATAPADGYTLCMITAAQGVAPAIDRREAEQPAGTGARPEPDQVAAGRMAGDPQQIGAMFWAATHGVVVLEMAGKLPAGSAHEMREKMTLALARGLRPGA